MNLFQTTVILIFICLFQIRNDVILQRLDVKSSLCWVCTKRYHDCRLVWIVTFSVCWGRSINFISMKCIVGYREYAPWVFCAKAPPHHRLHTLPPLSTITSNVINYNYLFKYITCLPQVSSYQPGSLHFLQRHTGATCRYNLPYRFFFFNKNMK